MEREGRAIHQWAVVGAGPAGIAAVGKLLDHGIPAQEIVWIDPSFAVGDFGTLWRDVPSNTKVDTFLKFLHACTAFNYSSSPATLALHHADPNQTCRLSMMAEALQWVSDHLKEKVNTTFNSVERLSLQKRTWHLKLKEKEICAANVILAMGAESKHLDYSSVVISLADAMSKERLQEQCHADDTIGVFGSSHSAILVLRNLIECGVKQIYNFYRSPLLYAIYFKDWILFDDTGLKGSTAEWARDNIDGQLPANLQRYYANEENIDCYLPRCNKIIYAVGFKRRMLPVIEGFDHVNYIEQAGIIAPGLFGFGIAFPETKLNPLGIKESRVGLWKFMDYLQRVMPIWLNYPA